jgi:protein-disulfide isomerase
MKENDLARDSASLIVAACVLAISIVTGTFLIKGSIDGATVRLGQVLTELKSLSGQLAEGGRGAAPSARPARPDPARKYEVTVGEAPTRGGPASAEVKIVEWSDFQCPFCSRAGPTLEQIQKEYGDQVQVAFKHMPLPMHSKAQAAHEAAEAAHKQGKFWEMHDKIFSDQRGMSEAKYLEYAQEIGLDLDQFKKDLQSSKTKQRIAADMAQASELGVTGTPAFFVNGRFLSGAQPFASFKRVIDEELAKN